MARRSTASEPVALAATMIVRNEARCLARCLDSVRPWVDRIVVVDTGSTDDTRAIARAAGAEVHRTPWRNSFALARNHALSLSNAEWNLVIDADERIERGGEGLRAWTAQAGARLGTVCIHSHYDAQGGPGVPLTSQSWITRLLPRDSRFRGRVHEQVTGDLPRTRLPLHLAHDGYRDAQLDRKRSRNRPLLLADLQDHPGDPYILYQLGRDSDMRGDTGDASRCYALALAHVPPHAPWRHPLVLSLITALAKGSALQAAVQLVAQEGAAWPDSPDFAFVSGDLFLDCAMADPAGALEHWLPLARDAWQRCLAIGERPDLEGSVHGRGSHLARHNLGIIDQQLAALGRSASIAA